MRVFPFTAISARGIHALLTLTFPDGTILRATTAETDVTILGVTWTAEAAVNITQIVHAADGSPASADIRLMAVSGTTVRPGMAAQGFFDGLPITIELFDVANPAAGAFNYMPGAFVGSAMEDTNGVVTLAILGKLSVMRAPMTEVYTHVCRARLGDDRCRVALDVAFIGRNVQYTPVDSPGATEATRESWGRFPGNNDVVYECTTAGTTAGSAPSYSTTIGATVTDGTVVFTVRQAWMVRVTGEAIDFYNIQLTTSPSNAPSALGNIIPRSGPLANIKIPIRAYDDGSEIVTLFEPYAPSNFPPGTLFDIHRGCDRILETCRDVFNNLKNMRAVPYAPTADLATSRA